MSHPAPRPEQDSLVRHSRREAVIVFSVWLIAMVSVISYCYLNGYNRKIESLTFVLGFPDWVFWGVVVPWAACTAFGCWFSFRIMKDDPLGEDLEADSTDAGPQGT